MKSVAVSQKVNAQSRVRARRLLLVGPKPPPIGGSPLTVQAMLADLAFYPDVEVAVINTSPATDVRQKQEGFKFEKILRSFMILPRYFSEVRRCDAVLVFANDLFSITLAPFLVLLARLFRKPFFLKPVAASLDLFINAQKKPLRAYLLMVLRSTTGILAQTQRLKEDLGKLGLPNASYLPGCRDFAPITAVPERSSKPFRIIFLAHVTRLKGPLVLLDAMRIVAQICREEVSCDFFGPIVDEVHDEFVQGLKITPNAHYLGVAEPGTGPQLIANYDALILPTYYDTEGHPGVLIEAMYAGVPVISTQIRTLPELVTDGVNGFLVPTQDSRALAEAIKQLAEHPALAKQMGEANRRRGDEFRADVVVAQMLKLVFPDATLLRSKR